jgi:hypothetical protein
MDQGSFPGVQGVKVGTLRLALASVALFVACGGSGSAGESIVGQDPRQGLRPGEPPSSAGSERCRIHI